MRIVKKHRNSKEFKVRYPFLVIRRMTVRVVWKGVDELRWCVVRRATGQVIAPFSDFNDALRWWIEWTGENYE